MDKAPIGITIFDLHQEDDPLVYANDRFDGLAQNDLEDRSDLTALFCDGKDSEMAATVQRAVEEGESVTIERCDNHDDRPEFWTKETFAPITDTEGTISEFAGFHRDITEDKEKRERLRQYKSAVEASPTWIFCIDSSERLIFANEDFRQFYGLDSGRVRGTQIDSIVEKSTTEKIEPAIKQALDGESVVLELETEAATGERQRFVRAVLSPLWDDDGAVTGVVGSVHDLSEVRQREQQLQVLDRVLRHNLRNEMNVIQGQAELIQSGTTSEIGASAGKIVEKSDQLLGLAEKERKITELLRDEPIQKEIEICDLLQQITSRLESEYPEATIDVDCSKEVTTRATTEFGQAIKELVTNAVVHDDSSSPEVTLTVSEANETVRIDIEDTGPRIPEIERNVLVGETEQTPLYHGGGLGLWLVNLIIAQSEGAITVEENSPTGNIVSIELSK